MRDVVVGVISAVLAAGVLAVVPWGWHMLRKGGTSANRRAGAWRAGRRDAARRRSYERCIAEKTADGTRIPVRHEGYAPTTVTYSDGSTSYHFNDDWEAYRAALESVRYPPGQTFPTRAPECPCGRADA